MPTTGHDSTQSDGTVMPTVRKVWSFRELLGAFALVQENYVRLKYKPEGSGLYHFSLINLLPQTTTLVGLLGNTITGTMTLAPDSELGMPCLGVFPDLCDLLRQEGHRLCEATMLADRRLPSDRAWPQLRALFHLLMQVAQKKGLTRLIVLCHPHHATFYLHRLPFQQMGEIRPCPHVSGSPAVPLLLDLADERLIEQVDQSLGHWGRAIQSGNPTDPQGYRLTDERAAGLVAIQPSILIKAPPEHRRVIVSCYPTLPERLRIIDAGGVLSLSLTNDGEEERMSAS